MKKSTLQEENHFVMPEIVNGEIGIFVNRLVGIFEIVMMKLELAATLPLIIYDTSIFEILNREDSKQIITLFKQFTPDQENSAANQSKDTLNTATVDMESFDPLKQSDHMDEMSNLSSHQSSCSCGSTKDRIDVYQLLQIVISNPKLLQLSKNLRSEKTKSRNFLRQIKYFMEYMITKTLQLPIEEREKELKLRKLCAQIEQSKLEISDLTVSLEEQKCSQRAEIQQLASKLSDLLNKWEEIDEEYNNALKQLLDASKENKAKSFEEFTERINNHQLLFEKLKTQLTNDKTSNKKAEHEIQTQKFKVESQLTSLIMKFDTEIGGRQETYDDLMKEYNDLEQEKSQLMDDMNEQLIIYNSIIAEREEKAFEQYREKYMKFVTNRSAKLIQRWWRSIRSKLKKRDKKKGKKKKKGKA